MKINKTIKTLWFTALMLMPISSVVLVSENNLFVTEQLDYKITDTQNTDETVVFKDKEHYSRIEPVFEEAHLVETYEYDDNEYKIYLSLSTKFHDDANGWDKDVIGKSTNYDLAIFISTSDEANWDSVDFEAYIEGPGKSYGQLEEKNLEEQDQGGQKWVMYEKSFRALPEEINDSNEILEEITKEDIVIDLVDNESNMIIIENQKISELSGFENWKNIVKSERETLNNQQHYLKENNELVVDLEEDLDGQFNINVEADIEIRNGLGKPPWDLPMSLSDIHNYYGLVADIHYDITGHNEITVGGDSVTIEKLNLEYAFMYGESNSSNALIVDSNVKFFNWGLKGAISNYNEIRNWSNDDNYFMFTSSSGDKYSINDLEIEGDNYDFVFGDMEYIYLNQSKHVNLNRNANSSVYYADYEFLPVNKTHEIINYVWVGISVIALITGIVLVKLTYKKQKININK